MEYLVTFIAPIVRQRSAHQCFVLSRVRSNENIVWLSSDSDDLKKTRHSVSLEFCCDRKLLIYFFGLTSIRQSTFTTSVTSSKNCFYQLLYIIQ